MAIGSNGTTLADVAYTTLKFYIKGKTMAQTIQEKPLLAWLRAGQKTFPGGNASISIPVQGKYFSDDNTLQGYTADEALEFGTMGNALRVDFNWYEVFYGWWINWTDLKVDGITVNDEAKTSEHSKAEIVRLTGILQNRLDDFSESWARATNKMFWQDGSQDSQHVPGITAILTGATTDTGSVGGISRATYTWWRHRAATNIAVSPQQQTLTKKLRSEVRQLRRYGGRPNKVFAGSKAIEAVEAEIFEKGFYTMEGFAKGEKNDLGMAQVRMQGVGTFDYDPTLDDFGMANAIWMLDSRKLTLYPMEGEDNKVLRPARPYNYLVYLSGMTWTGALCASQLNCHGYYTVAA
jgi:hypothetical protein